MASVTGKDSQGVPRFELDVFLIFKAKCLICHGGKLQQNGLDLRTKEGVIKGGESGTSIEPGETLLYEKVEAGSMPLEGERLTVRFLTL